MAARRAPPQASPGSGARRGAVGFSALAAGAFRRGSRGRLDGFGVSFPGLGGSDRAICYRSSPRIFFFFSRGRRRNRENMPSEPQYAYPRAPICLESSRAVACLTPRDFLTRSLLFVQWSNLVVASKEVNLSNCINFSIDLREKFWNHTIATNFLYNILRQFLHAKDNLEPSKA